MNLREIINKYRNEILKTNDLTPGRASEILLELSSIFGNVNDVIRATSIKYNEVLAIKLKQEKTVASAKILAEITPEYTAMREARDKKEEILELIRSLKYYLKSREEEYREAT